jgi:oligoribonuclease NrnB/cAMP/cGMP phosphodiesterase (DHH superfamily)
LESKPEIEKISNLAIFVNKGGSGALLTYAYTSMMYAGEVDDAYGRGNYITPTFDYEKQEVILTLQGCDKIFSVVYPEWVAYIDDYDRWAKMFEESNFFIKGCDAENTAISYKCREDKVVIYRGDDIDKTQVVKSKAGSIIFNTEFWEEIAMNTGKLIENGKIITDYCTQTYTKGLGLCFEYITEDGQRILVKNSSGNSLVFVDQIDKYDAVALFYYNGKAKVWNHSVYSYENSEFDCAAFCEKYGGGGHKHAAGFSHKTPIFL